VTDLDAPTGADRPLDPDEVSARSFPTAFRGFDPVQVRAFLGDVADELRRLQDAEASLRAQLEGAGGAGGAGGGDGGAVVEARAETVPEVSAEAAAEAEQRAAAIVAEAQAEADRLVREARDRVEQLATASAAEAARVLDEAKVEAARLRAHATDDLTSRFADAEATAVRKIAEAEREAASLRVTAREESEAIVEAARERGREMVAEAQAARERMLADLAKRKRAAQAQLEQLRTGRDRLLEQLKVARRAIDEVATRFEVSDGSGAAAPSSSSSSSAAAGASRAVAGGSTSSPDTAEDRPRPIRTRAVAIGEAPSAARPLIAAPQAAASTAAVSEPVERAEPPAITIQTVATTPGLAEATTAPAPTPTPATELVPEDERPLPSTTPSTGASGRHEERRSSALRILRRNKPATPAPAVPPQIGRDTPTEGIRILGRPAASTPDADPAASSPESDTAAPTAAADTAASVSESQAAAPTADADDAASVSESQAAAPTADADVSAPGSDPAASSPADPNAATDPFADPDAATASADADVAAASSSEPDVAPLDPADAGNDPFADTTDRPSDRDVVPAPTADARPTTPAAASPETASGAAADAGSPTTPAAASTPPDPLRPEEIRPRIEDLFARIRADREAATASARQVLAATATESDDTGATDAPPAVDDATTTTIDATTTTDDAPPAAADPTATDSDEHRLQARDAVVDPLVGQLTKRLKRALQDEQNATLDRLRTSRGPATTADQLLSRPDDQATPYRHLALPFLEQAARAGAAAATTFGPIAVPADDLAAQLADDLAGAVRTRLHQVLEAARNEALDLPDLSERISAVYREWKVQKVERLATHHLVAAHERGGFLAQPEGTPLRWLVDDDGTCPDCDDNALAGPTPRGEAFPTGQLHPPAHLGCRCLLAPTPA
jgi:DivIVA domain-containing protein